MDQTQASLIGAAVAAGAALLVGALQLRAQNRTARIALLERRLRLLDEMTAMVLQAMKLRATWLAYPESERHDVSIAFLGRLEEFILRKNSAAAVFGPEVIDMYDEVFELAVDSRRAVDGGEGEPPPDDLDRRAGTLLEQVYHVTAPYVRRERLWGLSWIEIAPRWWRVSDELHESPDKGPVYTPGSALRR